MIKLYNTATREKQEFKPLNAPRVTLYTCGPTVYDYQHIGNWRTFVFEDLLRRALESNGYLVDHVMNATDVGHLSGDNLGDADTGEDRMEKGAKREGKSVWDIAQFYLDDFVQTRSWLNILAPTHFVRATYYIQQQIELVERLIDRGIAYETETGVFFDVTKFPEYGKLSGQKLIDKRTASREEVEEDKTKKNPQDFALWFKTVGKFADHQMHWPSPWGEGFPGWHVECSAMAMSILGETIDIHTGGIDHVAIHHTNEIAQSEGATGKEFARYWLHGEFLTVDGGRMGKSLGNAYNLHDIKSKGYEVLALRYLYLGAHYRNKLNFTWEALDAAQTALNRLREQVKRIAHDGPGADVPQEWNTFVESINDDLNTPQALAVLWDVLKSGISDAQKYEFVLRADNVLGLELDKVGDDEGEEIPQEVAELLEKREAARANKDYAESDRLRDEISKLGYTLKDTAQGQEITKD